MKGTLIRGCWQVPASQVRSCNFFFAQCQTPRKTCDQSHLLPDSAADQRTAALWGKAGGVGGKSALNRASTTQRWATFPAPSRKSPQAGRFLCPTPRCAPSHGLTSGCSHNANSSVLIAQPSDHSTGLYGPDSGNAAQWEGELQWTLKWSDSLGARLQDKKPCSHWHGRGGKHCCERVQLLSIYGGIEQKCFSSTYLLFASGFVAGWDSSRALCILTAPFCKRSSSLQLGSYRSQHSTFKPHALLSCWHSTDRRPASPASSGSKATELSLWHDSSFHGSRRRCHSLGIACCGRRSPDSRLLLCYSYCLHYSMSNTKHL